MQPKLKTCPKCRKYFTQMEMKSHEKYFNHGKKQETHFSKDGNYLTKNQRKW